VIVANDGEAAVTALGAGRFDLVLMDCQMPRMGGFEATAAIRGQERETGGHVPIIAMTANVMRGFREECLAAGMDGYVAKPIRRQELVAVMAAVVPDLLLSNQVPSLESESAPMPKHRDSEPFDSAALLEGVGGDLNLVRELVKLCCEVDGPRFRRDLAVALKQRDLAGIEQAAHGLKGLVAEFHAPACFNAARILEETAQTQDREMLQARALELEQEFQHLVAALEVFTDGSTNKF
jgi:CheY-like chemotaxis protein